jgi:diacylglycerol kinase (ATP)
MNASSSTARPDRALLVANLQSGAGRSRKALVPVIEELARAGIRAEVHVTRGPWDAAEAARGAVGRHPLLVVAGGDGTVNEVLNGAAGSDLPVGLVPTGTHNVLAHELGIPSDPIEAARVVCRGHSRVLDLGRANDRYFILWTGIGFDAQVASRVKPGVKKVLGSAAFVLAALEEVLTYDPQPIRVRVDSAEEKVGYFVVVGNAKHYTRFVELTPYSDMSDGKLEVAIFKNRDLLHVVRYFLTTTWMGPGGVPDVEIVQGERVRLDADARVLAHVDCELLGSTPIEVEVAPRAFRLLVPERGQAGAAPTERVDEEDEAEGEEE